MLSSELPSSAAERTLAGALKSCKSHCPVSTTTDMRHITLHEHVMVLGNLREMVIDAKVHDFSGEIFLEM